MEFTGFQIQFVSIIIQVKYLVGSICQIGSITLSFWFVARSEANGACMQIPPHDIRRPYSMLAAAKPTNEITVWTSSHLLVKIGTILYMPLW